MILISTLSILLFITESVNSKHYGLSKEELLASPHYKNGAFHVEMSTESGKELLEHWAVQGFSGIVAAIATRRLFLVEEYQKREHQKCASNADTVAEHAKCLLRLEKDAHFNLLRRRRKYFHEKVRRRIRDRKIKFRRRSKREAFDGRIQHKKNYELKTEHDNLTPFGVITHHLANTLRIIKNKRTTARWQDTISRITEQAERIKKRKEIEKLVQKRAEIFRERPSNSEFRELEKYIENDELKEMMRKKEKNMTEGEKMMMVPMKLIRSATKLGLTMTGYNTSDFDRKVVRIFSPKFMSVFPQSDAAKENEIDILSPSLFSLYEDWKSENTEIFPSKTISKLLDSEKLKNPDPENPKTSGDAEKFLNFIVEATGVDEAMLKVEKKLETMEEKGPEGQPLYFTKQNISEKFPGEARKVEMFERLDKTYSDSQLREMNRTGYTIMTPSQLHLVYGKGSPTQNSKFLKKALSLSRPQIDREVMSTIRNVAREKLKFEARRKDIVLSPVTFTSFVFDPVAVSQPTILSPILIVSLIGSPAIYGVMILSPWVMVPVILSPRIFSPVILNPFVMVPIILSPLAFNPFILCPGTMNPFVLSPLVFSPFILSPQVMTPLILTPFCLGPIILNPLALNPLILSPFVLSPTILSPQYVSAVILSPYALSPNYHSDGLLVTVFGSPSWLS